MLSPKTAPLFRFSRVRVTVVHLYWATRFGEKTWLPLCCDIQRWWKESFLLQTEKKDLTIGILVFVWNCYGTPFCSLDLRDFHVSSDFGAMLWAYMFNADLWQPWCSGVVCGAMLSRFKGQETLSGNALWVRWCHDAEGITVALFQRFR